MKRDDLVSLLEKVHRGETRPQQAVKRLENLPFEDLGFARVDHHRTLRHGFPEVVFGLGKIILDGPPFIVSDPVVLSAKVDGVLIVIEPGKTKFDTAIGMIEQLDRAGARVVGAVMNPMTRKSSRYYSGKYHYYSKYYDSHVYGYLGDDNSGIGGKRTNSEKFKHASETKPFKI